MPLPGQESSQLCLWIPYWLLPSYSRSAIVFTLSVTAGWSRHLRTHVYVIMRICRLDACPEAILVVCPPEVASILGQ